MSAIGETLEVSIAGLNGYSINLKYLRPVLLPKLPSLPYTSACENHTHAERSPRENRMMAAFREIGVIDLDIGKPGLFEAVADMLGIRGETGWIDDESVHRQGLTLAGPYERICE
jgi:hypothetical protein